MFDGPYTEDHIQQVADIFGIDFNRFGGLEISSGKLVINTFDYDEDEQTGHIANSSTTTRIYYLNPGDDLRPIWTEKIEHGRINGQEVEVENTRGWDGEVSEATGYSKSGLSKKWCQCRCSC